MLHFVTLQLLLLPFVSSSRGIAVGVSGVADNSHANVDYVRRISDPDLYYAAESRNYPEAPNTLFLTMRGGGVKVFDISEPAELKPLAQWTTDRAVEGQDRLGDLLVVAELGRG